jgi:hypothetical protein
MTTTQSSSLLPPIQSVLIEALFQRGWKRLEGVKENAYGEVREWVHPEIDKAPMPLIDAYWTQESLDFDAVRA